MVMGLVRRMAADQTREQDQAALIAAARRGSADALGAMYDRHARPLLAIAYRLLQSRAVARAPRRARAQGNRRILARRSRADARHLDRRVGSAAASRPAAAAGDAQNRRLTMNVQDFLEGIRPELEALPTPAPTAELKARILASRAAGVRTILPAPSEPRRFPARLAIGSAIVAVLALLIVHSQAEEVFASPGVFGEVALAQGARAAFDPMRLTAPERL